MSESIILNKDLTKSEKYEALLPQLRSLVEGEEDVIANTANIIGALKEAFGFFWIGIYFVKNYKGNEQLVLGPFQGPVACVRIAKGKGVCGTSWANKESIVVPDVDLFPGHIACNSASKSEIVIPVIKNDIVAAIIDADSDLPAHFDETDRHYLGLVAGILAEII